MRYTRSFTDSQFAPPVEGVLPSTKRVLTASGRYAAARARLLWLETRLAAREVKSALVMAIVAVAALLVGLVLLTVAVVLWVARLLLNGDAALACGVMGGVLVLAAVLLAWRARRSASARSFFPVTKTEFLRDKEWLDDLPQKTRESNGGI